VRQNNIINIFFADPVPGPIGLAIYLGTTKIACYLVDLETGKTLVQGGVVNPQIAYGEDIMSRLSYILQNPGGLDRLAGGGMVGGANLSVTVTRSR